MEQKWTPGPYRLAGNGIAIAGKRGEGEILRATERFMDRSEREANAKRAFECMTAMDGIPDPAAYVAAFEAMRDALEGVASFLQNAPLESGVCCCGDEIEDHSYHSGHSPVDQAAYAGMLWVKDIRHALTAARAAKGGTDNG